MTGTHRARRPCDYEVETEWLRQRTPASGPNSAGSTTGYEPDGYEQATWVLHAMYEPVDPKPALPVAIDSNAIAAAWGAQQQREKRLHGVDFAPLGVANPDPLAGDEWDGASLPLGSGAAFLVTNTRRASDGSPKRAGLTICSLRPKGRLMNRPSAGLSGT